VVGGGPFCDAVLPATAGGIHRGRKKKKAKVRRKTALFLASNRRADGSIELTKGARHAIEQERGKRHTYLITTNPTS